MYYRHRQGSNEKDEDLASRFIVEDVAAAFREFKKFDLIRARDREKAELKKKRAQQRAMDEAGLNLYRRAAN